MGAQRFLVLRDCMTWHCEHPINMPWLQGTLCVVSCKCIYLCLTHWGRATHICVSKLTIIVSDNGLPPGRRQAIIWNNARILSIGLFGTKFSEILIEILTFSFKKMRLKVSSAKWRPFCLGLNVLSQIWNHQFVLGKIQDQPTTNLQC